MKDLCIETVLFITDIINNSEQKWIRASFGTYFVQYYRFDNNIKYVVTVFSDLKFTYDLIDSSTNESLKLTLNNFSDKKLRTIENDETLNYFINQL